MDELAESKPCKWKTNRKHVEPPHAKGENIKDKIFSENYIETDTSYGKRHFPIKHSEVAQYRPGIKVIRQQFQNTERQSGVKKVELEHAERKPRAERQHIQEKPSGSIDPFKGGLKAYPEKHQKTEQEHALENDMGLKKRVDEFDDKRNLLPFKSLGDKPYKFVEDSSGFYREGGLIPGSTHPAKMEKKGTGNTKIVDYYATLDLSKKVMKKGMTWKEKVKQEQLDEDRKAVNELINWEKTVLKDSDPKYYDPDEDSEEKENEEEEKKKQPEAKKAPATNKKPPEAKK